MNKNLEQLKELTKSLPYLSELIVHNSKMGSIEYKTKNGVCHGYGILNVPEIAVQYTIVEKNDVVFNHQHDEKEILIIYRGSCLVCVENVEYELIPGDIIEIKPNENHYFKTYDKKVWLLCITIPSSESYPESQ